MERDELAAVLFASAKAHAEQRGMRLGHEVHGDLRRLTLQAADRMLLQKPALDRRDSLVQQAETAFQHLVDEMDRQRPRYRDDGDDDAPDVPAMRVNTLRRALSQLCPLFPIC